MHNNHLQNTIQDSTEYAWYVLISILYFVVEKIFIGFYYCGHWTKVQYHCQQQAYHQQQDQAVAHLGQFLAGAQTAGAAAVPSPEELERLSLKKDKHGRHDEQNFTEE